MQLKVRMRIEVQTSALKSSAAMQIPEAEWRGLRYEKSIY